MNEEGRIYVAEAHYVDFIIEATRGKRHCQILDSTISHGYKS